MKLFISYCENDSQGLGYAKRAKNICKQRDIESWLWADDSSSAELLNADIAKNVDSCDAMLTVVTTGTKDSEPQKEEWSWASSYGRINCSLRKKGLPIPDVLRSRKSREFNDNDFEKICNKVIDDIVKYFGAEDRGENVEEASVNESQLHDMSKNLENNVEDLREATVEEFKKRVWEGYLGSNIVRNVVRFAEANDDTDKNILKNIAILKVLELEKFNAENYAWGGAFNQLGSGIARGEERYLIKRIKEEIEEIKESCNETNDELSTIEKEIRELNDMGYTPNVVLAPASMLKSFVHYFREGKVSFTRELGSAAVLEMGEDIKLGIYLLSKDILNTNVIIYDKLSILWQVCLNPETGYVLNMGVGKRFYPDRVLCMVGTTAACIVKDKQGIKRIPIER